MTDLVYVIVPTYNRREFLPITIYQFGYQDYPKEKLRLVIYDDSEQSNEDIINNLDEELKSRIKYVYKKEKKNIGYKRNWLNRYVVKKGAKYIVCFDDDDYYPSDKVSYTIKQMKEKKADISGSSIMLIYYPPHKEGEEGQIIMVGPYGENHSTNGTMTYTPRHLNKHIYSDDKKSSEESGFTNNFSVPLLQLHYLKTILCISHNTNTVDKMILKNSCKLTTFKLKQIIKDEYLYNFFSKITKII